jgi:hypothetical protein
MAPIRRKFGQRLEHEGPFMHSWVRQLHTRCPRADLIIVREKVQVEHAGGIPLAALSTEFCLYGV